MNYERVEREGEILKTHTKKHKFKKNEITNEPVKSKGKYIFYMSSYLIKYLTSTLV